MMKHAIGIFEKRNLMKYALLAVTSLIVMLVSCEKVISAQKGPEQIRFGRESNFGFSGHFAGGAYIDAKGNIYQVSSPRTKQPHSLDNLSDSLAIWVLSEGVLRSNTVPKDSLLLMDSLLAKAKPDTESVHMKIGDDIGVCSWFAFDPISNSTNETPLLLKRMGSTEYHLISEPAMQLTTMIDKYCSN